MKWIGLLVLLWTASVSGETLEFTAPLQASQIMDIYASIHGQVRHISVQVGDSVAVGDTLAWLDNDESRLVEAAARISYQKMNSRLKRAEKVYAKGGISTQELESLQYDTEAARIRWKRALLDRHRTVIRSPMTGIVAECLIQNGNLASPQIRLFQIMVPDTLKADIFIPADKVDFVQPEQVVTAKVISSPDLLIQGKIMRISPVINPESGTCKALVIFPDAGNSIKPGTVVKVKFPNK